MKVRLYLPITLLFSTLMYGSDSADPAQSPLSQSQQLITESTETTLIIEDLKKAYDDIRPSVTVLKTVASAIIAAPIPVAANPTASTGPETAINTKKRGIVTNARYWWFGTPTMVSYEISQDKFDPNQIVNRQLLYDALQEKAQVASPENLKQVHEILTNCKAKNIPVDDSAVIALVRSFAHTTRTNEEKALFAEATKALQNAEEKRTKAVERLNTFLAQSIDEIQAINAHLNSKLDAIYKDHEETITLGTNVKRLTRAVNKNVPADGYDSDPESEYDREFNAHKLGLDAPTALNHKLNTRTAENLKKIKNLGERIDKDRIETEQTITTI